MDNSLFGTKHIIIMAVTAVIIVGLFFLTRKIKLKTFYGITIVKKEYGENEIKFEKNSISKISTNENKIRSIIETLKTNKVTPMGLNDVLTELLKKPQYQGE